MRYRAVLVAVLLAAAPALAQQLQPYAPAAVTADDYARAERFLAANVSPLVYGASFFLGRWMLGEEVAKHVVTDVLLKTAAGNVVIAFALAVAGYAGVLLFTLWFRSRKKGHPHAAGH